MPARAIKPQGTPTPIPILTGEGEPVDALPDVGLATHVVEDITERALET